MKPKLVKKDIQDDIGFEEVYKLIGIVFPWDGKNEFYLATNNARRLWLNEKTGLNIPQTADFTYAHWLSRLREMAKELGR